MIRHLRAVIFATSISVSFSVIAESSKISGRIVGVTDGDTVLLLTNEREQVKIRLNSIDAPEKSQAFGNKSKRSLSDLCMGKDADVDVQGRDKYGRTLGELFCQGKSANIHQIENGFAWVYRKYSSDQNLIDIEAMAKAEGRGLWNDPAPVAPWDFRHGVRPETFEQTQERVKAKSKSGGGFSCNGKRYCREMASCDEAMFYLNQCGVYKLDRDRDGVPCETICGG